MKKKNLVIAAFITISLKIVAQQVVFTTQDKISGEDIFWKVNVNTPFIYYNLSTSINTRAAYSGVNKGPICTSHNGDYYIFQSERFDSSNNIDGYAAITICKSNFSYFEVPKDEKGNVFHAEGIMQISNDGRNIYFVQNGTTHTRDIFKITKTGLFWSDPIPLSSLSGYDYNISPYLSYDETKIIYECSNNVSSSSAIVEVLSDGTGQIQKTSITEIVGCSQMKSPCYDVDGNIYFEAETSAERIWKLNVAGGNPHIINNSFTNDNSPVTLPDGRIVSGYVGNTTHQIKIMNSNGLNNFMLTNDSSPFLEIFDIGISAGGNELLNTLDFNTNNVDLQLFPNPSNGVFTINTKVKIKKVTGFDVLGKEIIISVLSNNQFSIEDTGVYFLKIELENNTVTNHKLIISN